MRKLALLLSLFALAACDGDGNDDDNPAPGNNPPRPALPAVATFEVVVTNLTNAQPLSPALAVLHTDALSLFDVGAAASAELEQLAEGGSNAELNAAVAASAEGIASALGAAPIGPGGSEALLAQVLQSDLPGLRLSMATMLVNTNDAFTAVRSLDVSGMAVGDAMTVRTVVYDAGTEANSEAFGTIPGPADGGEGFNAARDDSADRVTMHPGVVSEDDGLATSVLDEQHRFDNPAAVVRISRIE